MHYRFHNSECDGLLFVFFFYCSIRNWRIVNVESTHSKLLVHDDVRFFTKHRCEKFPIRHYLPVWLSSTFICIIAPRWENWERGNRYEHWSPTLKFSNPILHRSLQSSDDLYSLVNCYSDVTVKEEIAAFFSRSALSNLKLKIPPANAHKRFIGKYGRYNF